MVHVYPKRQASLTSSTTSRGSLSYYPGPIGAAAAASKRPQKLNKRQPSFLGNILGPAFESTSFDTVEEIPRPLEDVAIVKE